MTDQEIADFLKDNPKPWRVENRQAGWSHHFYDTIVCSDNEEIDMQELLKYVTHLETAKS